MSDDTTKKDDENTNDKQDAQPLSAQTLFAFALPEPLKRNLIADATRIFKRSEFAKVLENTGKSGKNKSKQQRISKLYRGAIYVIASGTGILIGILASQSL